MFRASARLALALAQTLVLALVVILAGPALLPGIGETAAREAGGDEAALTLEPAGEKQEAGSKGGQSKDVQSKDAQRKDAQRKGDGPMTADHLICLRIPGAAATHYVVASYHVGWRLPVALGPRLRRAIESSAVIAFESLATGTSLEAQAVRQVSPPIGRLEPGLSRDLTARLDQALVAGLGEQARRWQQSSPLQVYTALAQLTMKAAKVDRSTLRPSLDEWIRQYAIDHGRALASLESLTFQVRVFNEAPTAVWEDTLGRMLSTATCEACQGEHLSVLDNLFQHIVAGDWPEVNAIAARAEDGALIRQTSPRRDPEIAAAMVRRARDAGPRSELYVLGGIHVADPEGTVALLRRQGVGVEEGCEVRHPASGG